MKFNSAFKGLNAELNPICHLLALLGAHSILHVSRIRVRYTMCILYSPRPFSLNAHPDDGLLEAEKYSWLAITIISCIYIYII